MQCYTGAGIHTDEQLGIASARHPHSMSMVVLSSVAGRKLTWTSASATASGTWPTLDIDQKYAGGAKSGAKTT